MECELVRVREFALRGYEAEIRRALEVLARLEHGQQTRWDEGREERRLVVIPGQVSSKLSMNH